MTNILRKIQRDGRFFSRANHSLVIFIVAAGVFLRFKEYLFNRSLWYDEAMLASSVVDKSFFQLLSEPLNYRQTAPLGFMALTKLFALSFGNSEYVLRLIPFLSALFSFLLYFKLLRRYTGQWGMLVAMTLFSLSGVLIRYSSEFKPYSTDLLIALIILLLGISMTSKQFGIQNAFQLGVTGGIACWFSFPALFMLGGLGLALLSLFISRRQWKELRILCVSLLCWGISFGIQYFAYLREMAGLKTLETGWGESFIPLNLFSLHDLREFFYLFVDMFDYPGALHHQPLLGAVVFIVGGYAVFRKYKFNVYLLLMPLLMTILASGFHKYPFDGRLLLFYVPAVYILITEGIIFLIYKRSILPKAVGSIILVGLLLYPIVNSASNLAIGMSYTEEIKPVLQYVQNKAQKNDVMYIYYGAKPAFAYYASRYGLDKFEHIQGLHSRGNWTLYKEDVHRLVQYKRVWFIFSHVYSEAGKQEDTYIVDYLSTIGDKKDCIMATRAFACLFEFNEVQ